MGQDKHSRQMGKVIVMAKKKAVTANNIAKCSSTLAASGDLDITNLPIKAEDNAKAV